MSRLGLKDQPHTTSSQFTKWKDQQILISVWDSESTYWSAFIWHFIWWRQAVNWWTRMREEKYKWIVNIIFMLNKQIIIRIFIFFCFFHWVRTKINNFLRCDNWRFFWRMFFVYLLCLLSFYSSLFAIGNFGKIHMQTVIFIFLSK